jgi:hypothetical protein
LILSCKQLLILKFNIGHIILLLSLLAKIIKMAKAKKTNPKKEMELFILDTLERSLEKIKEGMSEKKFQRNIKKASKLIAADFKISKKKVATDEKDITV